MFNATDAQGRAIYHTNVLMCIGTDFCLIGLAAICDEARRLEIAERMRQTGRAVIDLDQRQIGEFAGNAIELDGADGRIVAMSSRALKALHPEQITRLREFVSIVPLDVPTIELAGGSVRCMLAGIHLAPRRSCISADYSRV
jgi:hypothetical protein